MTLGSTTTLLGWNLNVAAGSTVVVPGEVQPHIGSLSGDGEVKEGPPSQGEQTQLSINPPTGETDEFDGVIDGSGGIVSMDAGNATQGQGAGTQIIGSINPPDPPDPNGSGAFQLQINSGAMLVNDLVNAQSLSVASNATFGGPAIMTFTGDPSNPGAAVDVTFDSQATFAVALNGTPASGDFTQLTDTDKDVQSSPPQSTVQLGGSDLSVSVGSGYTPKVGDTFTIISTTKGTIAGPFANAPGGEITTFDGVPFLVTYNPNSVSLQVASVPTTTTVGLASGSSSPSIYGVKLTFVATVAAGGNNSATPAGSIEFFDGNPSSGGTQIGTGPLNSAGIADSPPIALGVSSSPHQIYAEYEPSASTFDISSTTAKPVSVKVTPAPLDVTANNETMTYGGTVRS